jgi:hypothetical protein
LEDLKVARARVELSGALTFSAMGTVWKRGRPREITIPAEIAYYQRQSEFTVTFLPETAPVVRPPPPPPPPPSPVAIPVSEPVPQSANDAPVFGEAELMQGKKHELQEIARDVFGIDLPPYMNKAAMVKAILEAQDS